jgi:hypothetical protein
MFYRRRVWGRKPTEEVLKVKSEDVTGSGI